MKKKNAWVVHALSLELKNNKEVEGTIVLGLLPARKSDREVMQHLHTLYKMFRIDGATQLKTLNTSRLESLTKVIKTESGYCIGSNKFFIFADKAEAVSIKNDVLEWKIPGTHPDVKIALPDYPTTHEKIKNAPFTPLKIFG